MSKLEMAVVRAAQATAFEVWAPAATRVVLKVRDREYVMSAGPDGWWTAAVNGLGPAADYTYAIDGGEFLPDPRSPFQPYGVHGPSRRVDHAAFPWTDAQWRPAPIKSAIFYEAHVGTFTPEGTFEAAIGKLEHLVRLGVTHLELMPVAEFSGAWGWGYD